MVVGNEACIRLRCLATPLSPIKEKFRSMIFGNPGGVYLWRNALQGGLGVGFGPWGVKRMGVAVAEDVEAGL